MILRWLLFSLLAGGGAHTLACWLALQLDFFRAPPESFYHLFAGIWAVNLGLLLFALLRLNRFLRDEQMTGVVMVWSTLVVLVSAYYIDQVRLCIMVFFFAIVQTGVFRASRRLLISLGVLAIAGYGVIIITERVFHPAMLDLSAELIQWFAFSVVAVGAMFLAVDISDLRHTVSLRNEQLASIVMRIRDMAMHDELTGLYNRRHAMDRLAKLRELSSRGAAVDLHIAYLDLDHFKRINDLYGHAFGDEVLKRFAQLLEKTLTGRDFAARIGGEEFLLVMAKVDYQQALAMVEDFRRSWQETRFRKQPDVRVSVSIGFASYHQQESLTEWLARADAGLYEAKALGRNRCCIANEQREGVLP